MSVVQVRAARAALRTARAQALAIEQDAPLGELISARLAELGASSPDELSDHDRETLKREFFFSGDGRKCGLTNFWKHYTREQGRSQRAGKVLSAAHQGLLGEALSAVNEAHAAHQASATARATAKGKVQAVLDSANGTTKDGASGDGRSRFGKGAIARMNTRTGEITVTSRQPDPALAARSQDAKVWEMVEQVEARLFGGPKGGTRAKRYERVNKRLRKMRTLPDDGLAELGDILSDRLHAAEADYRRRLERSHAARASVARQHSAAVAAAR